MLLYTIFVPTQYLYDIAVQRLSLVNTYLLSLRLFSYQNIPPQCWTIRRNLCKHAQKGLETRPGYKAHSFDHQVSLDSTKPRISTQRGSRKVVIGTV